MGAFCGSCGSALGEGAEYCGNCGTFASADAPGPGVAELARQLGDDIGVTVAGLAAVPTSTAASPWPSQTTSLTPGPPGRARPVAKCILLFIVTFGIYSYFWAYAVHEELKSRTHNGMGGLVAVLLWFFLSPVVAFTLPHEVEQAYKARGLPLA
ncbi:MAG: DUF4234 domain-containing protein [Actinobacteria bacterium]|nr:DUF4234 domain-containing protein [Actinomycetota bacterium]